MTNEATTDTSVVLTLPAETVTNLAVIDKVEQMIASVEDEYATIPDCETKEGYALAKERRGKLTKARTGGDKARLAATKPLRDEQDRINAWWKGSKTAGGIEHRIAALETEYDAAIRAVDEARERERAAKAEAEAKRVAAIEERIAEIKAMPASAITLEQCESALDRLASIDVAEFSEFMDAAAHHLDESAGLLTERSDALLAQEAQRKAQAEQQAALDKQKAEQDAAAEKLAQQKRDADARDRVAKEQADAAEQARADEAARVEAEKKAEADRVEAEKAAEEKRIADEAQAKKDAAAKKKRDRELAKADKAEREAMADDAKALGLWLHETGGAPVLTSKAGAEVAGRIRAFLSGLEASIDELRPSEDAAA